MEDAKDKELGTVSYWDEHYAKEGHHDEWLRSWADLEPFLADKILHDRSKSSRILHLGSGDSKIPVEMARIGYDNQLCLDFSPTVVDMMQQRHGLELAGVVEWARADVRDMESAVPDASVDVVFDKGMLDVFVYGNPWHPPDEVKENVGKYTREVHRVLKDDGLFLCISFRQPHFVKPFFNAGGPWDVTVEVLGERGAFGYHAYILRKGSSTT